MPTLFRFVRTVALAAALVYAVLWSLANLVEPRIRPMSEPIESRILRDAGRQPAVPVGAAEPGARPGGRTNG
ncbi:histidine kinase [Chthonobacter albigriseus]|uniref:histidine kinase n=1 Tax=Chthonobacter albigriseus TaxID=1683161 RepID=UPI0031403AC9